VAERGRADAERLRDALGKAHTQGWAWHEGSLASATPVQVRCRVIAATGDFAIDWTAEPLGGGPDQWRTHGLAHSTLVDAYRERLPAAGAAERQLMALWLLREDVPPELLLPHLGAPADEPVRSIISLRGWGTGWRTQSALLRANGMGDPEFERSNAAAYDRLGQAVAEGIVAGAELDSPASLFDRLLRLDAPAACSALGHLSGAPPFLDFEVLQSLLSSEDAGMRLQAQRALPLLRRKPAPEFGMRAPDPRR
jgi:hypothetical protein